MWSSLRATFVIVPLVMEHTTPTIRRTACPSITSHSHSHCIFYSAIHDIFIAPFAFVPFASQLSILTDRRGLRRQRTPAMERVCVNRTRKTRMGGKHQER